MLCLLRFWYVRALGEKQLLEKDTAAQAPCIVETSVSRCFSKAEDLWF